MDTSFLTLLLRLRGIPRYDVVLLTQADGKGCARTYDGSKGDEAAKSLILIEIFKKQEVVLVWHIQLRKWGIVLRFSRIKIRLSWQQQESAEGIFL